MEKSTKQPKLWETIAQALANNILGKHLLITINCDALKHQLNALTN